jgi:hypothetical protein
MVLVRCNHVRKLGPPKIGFGIRTAPAHDGKQAKKVANGKAQAFDGGGRSVHNFRVRFEQSLHLGSQS